MVEAGEVEEEEEEEAAAAEGNRAMEIGCLVELDGA